MKFFPFFFFKIENNLCIYDDKARGAFSRLIIIMICLSGYFANSQDKSMKLLKSNAQKRCVDSIFFIHLLPGG